MPAKPRLLLLEDESHYVEQFRRDFASRFEIEAVNHTADLPWQQMHSYAGFLVDLDLQEETSGFDVLQKILPRNKPSVFVLTKDNSLDTRLKALRLGVCDFLCKDMSSEEIFLRIQNGLRRSGSGDLELRDLHLDTTTQSVRLQGNPVDITRIEFAILASLLRSANHNLSRSALIDTVWNGRQIGDGSLSTHIYNINRKLEAWPFRLRLVKGAGLILVPAKELLQA